MQMIETPASWRVIANSKPKDPFQVPINTSVGKVNATVGMDERDGQHKIAWVDYPKSIFNKGDIVNPSGEIEQAVKDQINYCNVCNGINKFKETFNEGPAPAEAMTPSEEIANKPVENNLLPSPLSIVSPGANFPKYVPFIANTCTGLFCNKLGKVGINTILSILADVASGSAADPGNKMAWRQLSDGLIDSIGLERPEDISALKSEIAELFDSYTKDGDLVAAIKSGIFKSANELLDNGVEVEVGKKKTTETKMIAGIKRINGRSPFS
jgi:hypothetical protein